MAMRTALIRPASASPGAAQVPVASTQLETSIVCAVVEMPYCACMFTMPSATSTAAVPPVMSCACSLPLYELSSTTPYVTRRIAAMLVTTLARAGSGLLL